jgi:hypothetical protein
MDSTNSRTVRRPVILAAILLVGAAVLLVALRFGFEGPVADGGIALDLPMPTAPVPEPVVEATVVAALPSSPPALPPAVIAATDPLKVILLPARVEDPDPAAEVLVNEVRYSTLVALRGMANVDVIDIGPAEFAAVAPQNAGKLWVDRALYRAVVQRYEGDTVAEIYVEPHAESTSWSVRLDVSRSRGAISTGASVSKVNAPGPGDDADSIGLRFAEEIADYDRRVADTDQPGYIDARNVLFDQSRPEQERAQALLTMSTRNSDSESMVISVVLDSESVLVAVDLATRSASAEIRQQIWTVLSQRSYPTLAQPLSNALLSDPDASVRREVALGLGRYLDAVGVRAALEQAARGDGSAEVRLAAQMAMMDANERQAFKTEVLLDRNLTPAERLAPSMIAAGRTPTNIRRSIEVLGSPEAALAYAEIISVTDDPELKLYVQSALRASLRSMRYFSHHQEAREVLEYFVENEPELAEELDIAAALANPSSPDGSGFLPPLR